MKKHICIIALMAFLIFAIAQNVFAENILCNSLNDVGKHWKAESKENAYNCLNILIGLYPLDSANQFTKGKLCMEENNYSCAYEMFRIGIVTENHRQKIISTYIAKADSILVSDKSRAMELYREAVKLDRSQDKVISRKLMNAGMENEAIAFDSELRQQIASRYYSLYQSIAGEEALPYLEKANTISNGKFSKELSEKKNEFGYYHLKMAKQLFIIPNRQEDAEVHRNKAVGYLGNKIVDEEMPLLVIYHNSDQPTFQIAKGQYSNYWISPPKGIGYMEFQSNKGSYYEAHFKSGLIVKISAGEEPSYPIKEPFRLYAVEDSDIRLVFIGTHKPIETALAH